MLTSLYIMNEQYDLAEVSLRKHIDEEETASDKTLAIIFIKRGELEKAEEIYQRSLFSSINNCESAMSGLAHIASKNKDDVLFVDLQKKYLACQSYLKLSIFLAKDLINTYH